MTTLPATCQPTLPGTGARLLDTRWPRLLLVLLCLALWTPGLFTLPPGDRDESRFAQATKQMMETGDFVRIENGLESRNKKPIGIHWLQVPFVAAARAAGLATTNPIWPYRLPSLLGGMVAVLACFSAGEALVGRRAALLGAGMLAASVVLAAETHIAKTDAALLGATTVVMAVLARAWMTPAISRGQAALFWLAMGAGVLLKGPITPMVAALTIVALCLLERRAAWLRTLRWQWGLPLMLAVVLPWFIAIGVATHGRFFSESVGGDLARKLASGDESHWGPPGLHLLLLPLLVFPATAALPAGAALAWRRRREPAIRFLLAWLLPAWLVFEAAPTKLPHYPLPLYPAVCLLLAHAALSGPALSARWRMLGATLAGVVAAALAVAALAAPAFLRMGTESIIWLGAPAAAGAAVAGWFAVRATAPGGSVPAVLAAVALYAGLLGWELPRLAPLWISPRVVAVLPPGRLGAVGYAEPSLMFLAGTDTAWLRPDTAAAALSAGAVDTLLVGDRDLPQVLKDANALGLTLRQGASVHGFNYARGHWVTLTVLRR